MPSPQSVDQSLNVRVYPNPATSRVLICVESIPSDLPYYADVVSATGEKIATIFDATPEGELGLCYVLDGTKLEPGNYFVRVANALVGRVVKFTIIR
jgi:hypothetical protein